MTRARLKFDKRPKAKRKPAKRFSSISPRSHSESVEAAKALRPTKPLKKKNAKRAQLNHARAYGGGYADFIRSLPCLVNLLCLGKIQAHHTKNGGMGRAVMVL